MIDSFEPNAGLPTGNGSARSTPAETGPTPSVEALLFRAGAISADQLGELVRDAVLTQRPVAAIALERGLATPEMLAALQPATEAVPGSAGDASQYVDVSSSVAAPSAVAPTWEHEAAVSPVVVQPASPPQAEPLKSLDERVQAAVARAAHTPAHAPVATAPPEAVPMIALPEADTVVPPPTFTVLVHLRTGERLAAETAATFENAAEVARSLAGQLARATEWPLIAGRCIRPDAVVSVDIERTLER